MVSTNSVMDEYFEAFIIVLSLCVGGVLFTSLIFQIGTCAENLDKIKLEISQTAQAHRRQQDRPPEYQDAVNLRLSATPRSTCGCNDVVDAV